MIVKPLLYGVRRRLSTSPFSDQPSSRTLFPNLFRVVTKSVFLPLAGIAVIAIGVGVGNHLQHVDWPALVIALKGSTDRAAAPIAGSHPSTSNPSGQSPTGTSPLSSSPAMPTPLNIAPIPAGVPAQIEVPLTSTVAVANVVDADAAQPEEVSLRSTTKGARSTGEQQEDSTVRLKRAIDPPKTPSTPTASPPSRSPNMAMKAVAISDNRLVVQVIGSNGHVRHNQIAPGDSLPNGQMLLELNASTGKYTTNAGTWALWEQK
ncbi:hypothetical protein LP417_35185 (plasmid) [Polaromonas sp. P1-6]|nr:hypothetical protein LP417_35185 [Polaromonas sp. P1-6]